MAFVSVSIEPFRTLLKSCVLGTV